MMYWPRPSAWEGGSRDDFFYNHVYIACAKQNYWVFYDFLLESEAKAITLRYAEKVFRFFI